MEKKTLIIIPCFNEAKNIKKTIKDLQTYFKDILVVNDGSEDETIDILEQEGINFISHLINIGQGAALGTGLRYFIDYTSYDYAITYDGDGQHCAEDAYKMFKTAQEKELDAVIGSRFMNKRSINEIPISKRILLSMATSYEKYFHSTNLTDAHNGLRVLGRKLIKEKILPIRDHSMGHATEISSKICNSKLNYCEYPVYINYKGKKSQGIVNSINLLIQALIH